MITVKLHSVQRILLEVVLYTKDTIDSNQMVLTIRCQRMEYYFGII